MRLNKGLIGRYRFFGLIEEKSVFRFQKHHVRRFLRLCVGRQKITAQCQARRVIFCPMFAQSIVSNGIRSLVVLLKFPQQLIQRLARFFKFLLRHLVLSQIKQQVRFQWIIRVAFQGCRHDRLSIRMFS